MLALLEASNLEEELGWQPKFTEEVEHLVLEQGMVRFQRAARVTSYGNGCTFDMDGVSALMVGVSAPFSKSPQPNVRISSCSILCHAGAFSNYPTFCSYLCVLHAVAFVPSVYIVSWLLWVILAMYSNMLEFTDLQWVSKTKN